jgi:hypothetical protein
MRRIAVNAAVILTSAILISTPGTVHGQGIDWDSPAFRQDLQSFQQFLTLHPWIAGKLKEKPPLANDAGFLRHSPELLQFLNAHPIVQSDFKIDPNGVMSRAENGNVASPKMDYQETLNFKHFLSAHPWTAGKLKEKPALGNDKGFVRGDHEFQEFLNAHPYVQAQFRADPNAFMQQVEGLADVEPRPGANDPHDSDFASLKAFLQNHPWISDKLKEDPSRANDKDFLNKSKELRQFLQAHPYLEGRFKQDARHTLDLAHQSGEGYL